MAPVAEHVTLLDAVSVAPTQDTAPVYNVPLYIGTDHGTVDQFIGHQIESGAEKASFLVTNLTTIANQVLLWRKELSMVDPHYAMKCHPNPTICRLLASM
ncbi:ornithine decarboxylase, partial [Kipferlia bialata]|eukprot:g12248.t1